MVSFALGSSLIGGRREKKVAQYIARQNSGSLGDIQQSDSDLCERCQRLLKYSENGLVYPYCVGRYCPRTDKDQSLCTVPLCKYCGPVHTVRKAQLNFKEPCIKCKERPQAVGRLCPGCDDSVRRSTELRWGEPDLQDPEKISEQICQIPGCAFPVSVRKNGLASGYCGDAHKRLGKRGCISCRRAPTKGIIDFCQACYTGVLATAPMIVEVPEDHERYKNVKLQFREAWSHGNRCPEVRAVYKVVSTWANVAKYERYLNQVEMKREFAVEGKHRGNEGSRWQGVTRTCNIGDKGVTGFCWGISCPLCCTVTTSLWWRRTDSGRFGGGIPTFASSSKSDSYSRNQCISEWKAMVLSKVVIGRGCKWTNTYVFPTRAPDDHDSVIEDFGIDFVDDGVVVTYNNDAILPSYLVMYDIPK